MKSLTSERRIKIHETIDWMLSWITESGKKEIKKFQTNIAAEVSMLNIAALIADYGDQVLYEANLISRTGFLVSKFAEQSLEEFALWIKEHYEEESSRFLRLFEFPNSSHMCREAYERAKIRAWRKYLDEVSELVKFLEKEVM